MDNLKDWFVKARAEGLALPAFNLDSLETLKAVAAAAKNTNSPVIVEVSPGELDYLGLGNFASLVDNARRETATPIFSNLDHATDFEILKISPGYGLAMVHFDGSQLDMADNIRIARQVVNLAHGKNILVEGEIDRFPGESQLHTGDELRIKNYELSNKYTDPETARKFVEETGVDILAVFIGNKHGVYADGSERLDINHLEKLRAVLPETFFSLHGGSGISGQDIQAAIKLGVVKININTELRLAWRRGLEESFKNNPHEAAWYKLTGPALEAVQTIVENKIRFFGSTGKLIHL